MINQLINNVPRLLKSCEINFHKLEKKREIRENFPVYGTGHQILAKISLS